jgi:hypothetical protein
MSNIAKLAASGRQTLSTEIRTREDLSYKLPSAGSLAPSWTNSLGAETLAAWDLQSQLVKNCPPFFDSL